MIHTPGATSNQAGSGLGMARPFIQSGTLSSGGRTVVSSATSLAMPKYAVIVPKVTMNGATLSVLIIMPLTPPAAQPVSTQRTSASSMGPPCLSTQAITVAHNATAVPAERSMPPAMMTTVIPRAATTTGADEISIVCKFLQRQKPAAAWLQRVGHGEKDKHQQSANSGPNWPASKVQRLVRRVFIFSRFRLLATAAIPQSTRSAGRISRSRPRDMTPIRSHTRSSS